MSDLFAEKAAFYGRQLMNQFGLTMNQAAGAVGNLAHESGQFRFMQEIGHKSGRGGAGVGMWTGPRRVSFEAWCHQHGVSTSSDAGNWGYLAHELSTSQAGSIRALKKCTTVDSATVSFCNTFERPGVPLMSSRLSLARKAYAVLHAHG